MVSEQIVASTSIIEDRKEKENENEEMLSDSRRPYNYGASC